MTTTHPDRTVTLMLTMQVANVSQLSRVLSRIESVRDVYDVRRDAPMATTAPHSTAPAD